jgi:uncharacterized membrane-anchored protein
MKTKFLGVIVAGLLAAAAAGHAGDQPKSRAEAIQLVKSLKYQQGDITLNNGLAKLSVPTNFNYLGPEDAETVMVKLWGNPANTNLLGMLMPADKSPIQRGCWAVTIAYTEDGYVKDDDAVRMNYDNLMKKMQDVTQKDNQFRVENGYPAVDLVGWAAPPHYDPATHKMYWAKKLQFAGADHQTLNYDVRILGRRGVLVLSAVAQMDRLDEINREAPQILSMVNFVEGNRYGDFDAKSDKVADYGVASLVAGGVVAASPAPLNPVLIGLFAVIFAGLAVLAVRWGRIIGRGGQPIPR